MSTEVLNLKPEAFDPHLEEDAEKAPEGDHSARSNLRASGAHAVQAAEELKAAAEAKAREWSSAVDHKTAELKEKAEEAYEEAITRVKTLQKEAESYVRANPVKAVLMAAGAGFLVGVLARR